MTGALTVLLVCEIWVLAVAGWYIYNRTDKVAPGEQ
jgi:hypothetical protein